jgi:hypothetical protein
VKDQHKEMSDKKPPAASFNKEKPEHVFYRAKELRKTHNYFPRHYRLKEVGG